MVELGTRVPIVSAIVVTHDRAVEVSRCLASLRAQTEPDFEIVVVLNGASADVGGVVARLAQEEPRIRSVAVPTCTASEARNRGVEAARGSLLYFLDDDVEVPPQGVRAAMDLFASRDAIMIAGGPNLTPPDDPEFSQMCGDLLASPFGTGIAHYRYAPGAERAARERHLTLCNLVVSRRLFDAGMRFPGPFGGEENVLMGRARHLGHRLWYSPALWVHHRRRSDLSAHLAQVQRYGLGRGIAMMSAPGNVHPAYFAPLFLVVYSAVAVPAAALGAPLLLLPMALYGLLALAASVRIAVRRRRGSWALRLPALFALTHAVYAVGLVKGLVRGVRYSRRPGPKSALDTT